ncbi:hypothetical protein [Chitinophaga arvensicola]|uniref:Uncharacterized protein n=1 Tax=Chitinophaga arvensicola TaxID=29529 RepID=A0A1I0S632_9BACT|nr:hypothetical protein [Chitinophaga arvensicola]SEW50654.1 hypothetical protein SAMN04488122_3909 [Chitinophaga arvensicola]
MENLEREMFADKLRVATSDYLIALHKLGVPIRNVSIDMFVPVGDLPAFGTTVNNIMLNNRLYGKVSKQIIIDFTNNNPVISGIITVHEQTPDHIPDMPPGF